MSFAQQFTSIARVGVAASLALAAMAANSATVNLAGSDGTGYLAFSNVKNTTSLAAAEAWNYAYYLGTDNIYHSIAASPLSATSVYAEEATYTVLGKDVTQADFATFSAGAISYDASVLTGVGTEVIATSALTLAINSQGFSPFSSGYNTGGGIGDFSFNYTITPSNITGAGLTFVNGQLTSIDLNANIAVKVGLGNLPYSFGSLYNGALSISGSSYAFALDVTQNNTSPLGNLTNTHMVFNRAGSIAGVSSAVPEPSSVALMLAGFTLAGLVARRRASR